MVRRAVTGLGGRSLQTGLALLLAVAVLGGCISRAQLVYRRAEIFFGQGEYEMATAEYQRVVDAYPDDPLADDALYKLGHLYRVHLRQPGRALAAYSRLAEDYPASPFADDALLWCVHVWARDIKSPSRAAHFCAELDRRFASRRRMRARAHIEVARAELLAGDRDQARREIELVRREFSDQPEIAGLAALMLADLARAEGAKEEQVSALLESVVSKYPGTRASDEARRRLGMLYYVQRQENEKQLRETMKREACWLRDVPQFRSWLDPRLTMLEGLRSLLRYSGCQVSLPVLAAVSERALVPVAEINTDRWPVLWEQDPLVAVAEVCGMAPSVWVSQKKEEAWEAARRALIRGQPCLVAYSTGKWMILAGWHPQQQEVGVLEAGASGLRAMSVAALLKGWSPASKAAPFIAFPDGAYCVFTISGQRRKVEEETLRRLGLATVGRLPSIGREAGLTKPVDLARKAAVLLSQTTPDKNPPVPADWVNVRLPRWAEVRRVLGDFLQPLDPRASEAARHIADVIGSLREALRSAQQSNAPARDYEAAASNADRLASEEDNFERTLSEAAGS